eukprot:CAMPEP_0174840982 /NCGR_PEP_ID=MMETSP1114-20130205/9020_1 /TAXON_ID=312471 /ORGANISM="Neobodo designis, Strain CCAP 1951/1" /LENGTH=97 /DNA_ID=CAMNT_0016075151 /DNA_START=232 /DNA_END=524 /DNA_ORIENTATION=-
MRGSQNSGAPAVEELRDVAQVGRLARQGPHVLLHPEDTPGVGHPVRERQTRRDAVGAAQLPADRVDEHVPSQAVDVRRRLSFRRACRSSCRGSVEIL